MSRLQTRSHEPPRVHLALKLASLEKGSYPPAAAPSNWPLPPARSVAFHGHARRRRGPAPTASAGGGPRAPVAELAVAMERRDTVLASSYRPDRQTRLAARPVLDIRPTRAGVVLARRACSTPLQCAGVRAFSLHGRGFRVVVAAAFAKRSWRRRGCGPSVRPGRESECTRAGKRRDPCGGLPSCRRVSCVTVLIADVACTVRRHAHRAHGLHRPGTDTN